MVPHALLYALLLGASIVSASFSQGVKNYSHNSLFRELPALSENAVICEPIEETERASYNIDSGKIKVYFEGENRCEEMDLEEYVIGVLLAEMPSSYDMEALKAGAVAARTYTLYKTRSHSHGNGADVCTSSSHCQAYYSFENAVAAWNDESASSAYEKIAKAVRDTEGEILVFEGEPILALYHASSYLKTRSSAEVFGGELPYLQSVDVPHEDAENTRFCQKRFSKSDTWEILSLNGGISLESVWENSKCLGLRVYYEKGNLFFSPQNVRKLFSLPSGNFEVREENGEFVFSVYGYGHGVGMSQTGCEILAREGYKYEDILLKYYTGVSLAILKIGE